MSLLKGFFDTLQGLLIEGYQKLDISNFQSQFWRPKFNLIFLKMIFLSEYLIRRTTFISSVLNIHNSQKTSFSKMGPQFLMTQHRTGGSYKNLGVPVLKDIDRIEHILKGPHISIWEILRGPVAPLAPLVPPALQHQTVLQCNIKSFQDAHLNVKSY